MMSAPHDPAGDDRPKSERAADRIERLLHYYALETGAMRGLEAETLLADMISDACHFADRIGAAPSMVLDRALFGYVGDVRDETPRARAVMRADVELGSQSWGGGS